jgi:hypothetical protein
MRCALTRGFRSSTLQLNISNFCGILAGVSLSVCKWQQWLRLR